MINALVIQNQNYEPQFKDIEIGNPFLSLGNLFVKISCDRAVPLSGSYQGLIPFMSDLLVKPVKITRIEISAP